MNTMEILDPVRPVKSGGYKVDVSRGERNGRVSSEWFNRPDDERYLSLDDLWANVKGRSERSRSRVVQTADIRVEAARDARRQGRALCVQAAAVRARQRGRLGRGGRADVLAAAGPLPDELREGRGRGGGPGER